MVKAKYEHSSQVNASEVSVWWIKDLTQWTYQGETLFCGFIEHINELNSNHNILNKQKNSPLDMNIYLIWKMYTIPVQVHKYDTPRVDRRGHDQQLMFMPCNA